MPSRPAYDLQVPTAQLEGISDAMRDRELIPVPVRRLLFRLRRGAQKASVEAVDGGTGKAIISVGSRVQPLELSVFSRMPVARAESIERGRQVGETVPIRQLVNWRRTQPPSVPRAERLQELIRARGTSGKRFIRAARDYTEERLPGLIVEMAEKVARKIERAAAKGGNV